MRRAALAVLLAGCEISAAEHGADLFADKGGLSSSQSNDVSCATCHQTGESDDPGRVDAGYNLHGVMARESYWGGGADTLREAVDTCLTFFMRSTAPLDPESDEGRALWAYLESITPEGSPSETLPMTIVENIAAVPVGDEARGCDLFERACTRCHGDLHTGAGRIDPMALSLPDEAVESYAETFPGIPPGLVVIEKIRHGRFFATPGVMAPYSLEALPDEAVGDLLACFGISAE
jgi:thiosulfate dehydrogenase